MNKTKLLVLGLPYPSPLPVENGAVAEFLRPAYNRLLIAVPHLDNSEKDTLDSGKMTVKLHRDPESNALMVIFSFYHGDTRKFEFDCPFDASIVPDIELHSVEHSEKRLALEVVVLDTGLNEIAALRFITFSNALTVAFMEAIQYQLSSGFSSTLATKWIISQMAQYTPEQLADLPLEEYELGGLC